MAAEAVKEKKDADAAAGAAHDGDVPPPRRRSKKPLLIALVVVAVAVGQGVITWLLLPAVTGDAAHAEPEGKEAAHTEPSHAHHDDHHAEAASSNETVEVTVGDFICSNGSASPGNILHVTCKVVAIAAGNQSSTLEHQLQAHQARVRQAVSKILRSSNLEELHDPNVGTIKRLIREELNRLMRKSLIIEIVVTDIRVIEQ